MTALDSALAAIDQAVGQTTDERTLLSRAIARGLTRGYDARWACDHMQSIRVEEEFACNIYNPYTVKAYRSRTFSVAGKIDVEVFRPSTFGTDGETGKHWIIDHKTTSDDIEDPDATYWRQLQIDGQPNLYLLAKHYQGETFAGAIWDVIRKPGIRPKLLAIAERKAITSLKEYFGRVDDATAEWVAKEDKPRETPDLFEARLTREVLDNPSRYYQRKPVFRLEHEMAEYARELWMLAAEVTAERRRFDKDGILPVRNSASCLTYGTPCEFLGLCSGYDQPDSDRWHRKAKVHEELSIEDGRDVLTHSRLRCFQFCKRKHYYRYELGIERADREVAEALWFGTIMHVALAAWWSHFLPAPRADKEPEHGNSIPGTRAHAACEALF